MRRHALYLLILAACSGDKDLGDKLVPVPGTDPTGHTDPIPQGDRPLTDLYREDGTLAGHETSLELGTVTGDSDADGLTDEDELTLETNPQNPDTDGDALLDGWEVKGVDGTKLATLGADPRHRDVFVEMDYMERATATHGLRPSNAVLAALTTCFDVSPTQNPDGTTGIHLHLENGNQVTYSDNLTAFGFYMLKGSNFNIAARARCFHYMIWADRWALIPGVGRISGQSMAIPDSNFVVTLGEWGGGDDAAKIGTFLHELGHNLDLKHGGGDHVKYKPNHLSVMNYTWQLQGLKRNGAFGHWGYQWFDLPQLDENDLDENDGIGGSDVPTDLETAWFDPSGVQRIAPGDTGIDWNFSQVALLEASVSVDLNRDGTKSVLTQTPNEWALLRFDGGTIGSGLAPADLDAEARRVPESLPEETLDFEAFKRIRKDLKYQ